MSRRKSTTSLPEPVEVPPAVPPQPLYLSLDYSENRTGGGRKSDEEWSDRFPTYITVEFHSLSRGSSRLYNGNVEVTREQYEAQELYVVIVRYRDGDTFGSSHGHWTVAGVALTADEARKIEADARKPQTDISHYREWDGYFSGLEGVEIHCFRIREDNGGGNEDSASIRYHG